MKLSATELRKMMANGDQFRIDRELEKRQNLLLSLLAGSLHD